MLHTLRRYTTAPRLMLQAFILACIVVAAVFTQEDGDPVVCELVDYMSLNLLQFHRSFHGNDGSKVFFTSTTTSESKEEQEGYFAYTVCDDIDKYFKVICGKDNESKISMVTIQDDKCVELRELTDIITAIGSIGDDKDPNSVKILYAPSGMEDQEKSMEVCFGNCVKNLSQSMVLVNNRQPVNQSSISVVKLSSVYHSQGSLVTSSINYGLTIMFAYSMFYHNQVSRTWAFELSPFAFYLDFDVFARLLWWADAMLMSFTIEYRKDKIVATILSWVFLIIPLSFAAYRQSYVSLRSIASKNMMIAYIIITLVDYSVYVIFLSYSAGIVAIAWMLFVMLIPRAQSKSARHQLDWAISLAVINDLFMQHILRIPFKKIGAIKLLLAGLSNHYIEQNPSAKTFAWIMVLSGPILAVIRYHLSKLRTLHVEQDLAYRKNYVEQSGLYLTRLDGHAEPVHLE